MARREKVRATTVPPPRQGQRERKRESGPKLEFDDRFQFLPVSVDGCSLAHSLTHAARRARSLGAESEDMGKISLRKMKAR